MEDTFEAPPAPSPSGQPETKSWTWLFVLGIILVILIGIAYHFLRGKKNNTQGKGQDTEKEYQQAAAVAARRMPDGLYILLMEGCEHCNAMKSDVENLEAIVKDMGGNLVVKYKGEDDWENFIDLVDVGFPTIRFIKNGRFIEPDDDAWPRDADSLAKLMTTHLAE
ncbi:MAG: hypothetical protein CMA10_04765 [Euryarchaeota archaeon]|nr:hypothetical protein [Euryarchaeota archaeon]|tara:strand:- start:3566 stop:4063 length:498 start_codon:yes stop_codon:yes gene_type:complete